MLTKIIINNINSIGHCEVSFLKNKYQYLDEMIYNDTIVNPIAIYGANGSGKTSLILAVSFVISKLIDEPNIIASYVPNYVKLAHDTIKKYSKHKENNIKVDIPIVSSVELYFELDKDKYRYILETTDYRIISKEELFVNDKAIIERDKVKYVYNSKTFALNSQSFPVLRSIARDELIDTFVKKAYDFLSGMSYIDANERRFKNKYLREKSSMDLLVEKSAEVSKLLKKYRVMPIYEIYAQEGEKNNKYYFSFEVDKIQQMPLPIDLMSNGMYNNSMMLSLVLTMPKNSVLFIDEIECALHPLTIMDFITVVREKNIQLIFTSHNTFLLQQLRPDQIFFANWNKGYSSYKRLSDIYPNIRQVNNIEKMYLGNMFEEEIKK